MSIKINGLKQLNNMSNVKAKSQQIQRDKRQEHSNLFI